MKKTLFRFVSTATIVLLMMISLQSCGAFFSAMQDENFREDFRQGWNMTAPVEWRY